MYKGTIHLKGHPRVHHQGVRECFEDNRNVDTRHCILYVKKDRLYERSLVSSSFFET